MKNNNKNLILITNDNIRNTLKDESNITFLFPIKGFTVGFPKTYELPEIKEDAFIFLNRILDNAGIEKFKALLPKIPSNIKGIVFDDIGVLNVLKDYKGLTKILFLNHFNSNHISVNSYLKYVDSLVINPDITKEETKKILAASSKPLVLYAFGHVNIMYSRRTLLTNYNNHFNSNISSDTILEESVSKTNLRAIENEYGTVIYTKEPFNNLSLKDEPNILYNLINPIFLSESDLLNILKGNVSNYTYKYLSEKETIYKVKGEEE